MQAKFDIYDFLTNLIPGLVILYGLNWFSGYLETQKVMVPTNSLADTPFVISIAFVLGLVLQGVAEGVVERTILIFSDGFPSARWLLNEDTHFNSEYKSKLKRAIERFFEISAEPSLTDSLSKEEKKKYRLKHYSQLFSLCYSLVQQKKLSERPLVFVSHYGLFRSLFTLATISFIVLGSALLNNWREIDQRGHLVLFLSLEAFFAFAGTVWFFRMKKRSEDLAKSVYDLFYSFYSQDRQEKAKARKSA